jgi:1-deoxy-D-xylulose-5-phosphate synthase
MTPRRGATWTQKFAESLVELARSDERVVAITAAMPDGTGLTKFREEFPDRYIDVGISESHAVAMAGGLARSGLRPVVAIYSTFMQRAFDQVFHELALQKLPVLLCMDRAGLVGSDGAVHHGFADIAYLRALPGMVLMGPADGAELKQAMSFALSLDAPAAIRYPRDEVVLELPGRCPPFRLGRSRRVKSGDDATILAYGAMLEHALDAAEILKRDAGLGVAVINARFAKPSNVHLAGLPDRFIPHASRLEQLTEAGLDPKTLAVAMKRMIRRSGEEGQYRPVRKKTSRRGKVGIANPK